MQPIRVGLIGIAVTGSLGVALTGCPVLCNIDDVGHSRAGSGATGCGTFVTGGTRDERELPDGGLFLPDAGIPGGIDCALNAQDAGHPFFLHVTQHGVDTGIQTVFVRTPDGKSFQLTQSYSANFGGSVSEVDQTPCSGFAVATDPGAPGLACQSAGPSSTACP